MNISYNWLKDFIDLKLTPQETAETLTLTGLEVEEVTEFGNSLDGVIAGEVLEVKEHPNADKLRLCFVDTGSEKLQIVCGADNVAEGQKVPVAMIGTTLPITTKDKNYLTVKKAKLRGEVSNGMICAEDELGLGTDHEGIMVLEDTVARGTTMSEIFDLYRDTIFNIAITPNRPDATCHLGIARDLAAALDLQLCKPFKTELKEADPLKDIEIEIENPEKCLRYVGMLIEDVRIDESPPRLKNRLEAIGIRPVNNVVDTTNYVMYEMGQPLHAFDLSTLKGNKIIVRDFDEEIEFETLDHVQRTCSPGTLFICDQEEPVAIAGVMGGVDSEVSDDTTNILLESAFFDPQSIRKTAREQNLQTDASYRFERAIDPGIQRIAAHRAAELIADFTGGDYTGNCTDVHPQKTEPRELTLRVNYVNRLLGTDLTVDKIATLLEGLELETISREEESIKYRVPTFRPDLEREVDLIEEVGRLYDYNKIPAPSHVKFASPKPISKWETFKTKARQTAKGLQFREIYTNSLMPDKDAKLFGDLDAMIHTLNPISVEMTTLRPSLLYGFLKTAGFNFNRNIKGIRLFEMGNVFQKTENGTYYKNIEEETRLLLGVAGFKTVEHWKTEPQQYDIFDLKAAVNNFITQFVPAPAVKSSSDEANELLHYSIYGEETGYLTSLPEDLLNEYEIEHPVFAAELSLDKLFHAIRDAEGRSYEPVSKFPSFEFDFAVVVDSGIKAGELLETIRDHTPGTLKKLNIFDVFEGESLGKNKKSLAFRLSFIDKNKTLTINDIEPIIEKVLNVLEKRFSAKLRS